MNSQTSGAARWFTRVMWIGIVANLALAVPTLVAPARIAPLSGLPLPVPIVWLRFSALLLILLSVFYMPAAMNPDRYRTFAWLAVSARLAGVAFFVGFQPREYHMLGYFDLVFFVPEFLLLWAMSRSGQSAPAPAESIQGRTR